MCFCFASLRAKRPLDVWGSIVIKNDLLIFCLQSEALSLWERAFLQARMSYY